MLKLIDVRAYSSFNGICANCGRKLKNEYILSDNRTIGSECIIKILGDSLEIQDNIRNLSSKLKTIKFILNKCNKVLVCSQVLENPKNPKAKRICIKRQSRMDGGRTKRLRIISG